MITTTLDSWEDPNHRGNPQAAFENFSGARTDPAHPRHDEAIGVSLLVLPGDLGPTWEVGEPLYSRWKVPPIPPVPRKDSNKEREVFGYSIVDLRNGGVQLYPPVTETSVSGSAGYPFTATSIRREVWNHQPYITPGVPTAATVLNRLLHGGSSVGCYLVDMDPGKGRWYPSGMESICPGQQLAVVEPGNSGQKDQEYHVTVQTVGWDAEHKGPDGKPHPLPYFTVVVDPTTPLPPTGVKPGDNQTLIQRKTFLDPLSVIGEDHTPNQGAGALFVDKHAYSDGDSFASTVHLSYQGDFVAAGGDEGGIGGSFELRQDLQVFSGYVEDFRLGPLDPSDPGSPQVWQLTYAADPAHPHTNVEKIGAGRPIINMSAEAITGTCSLWNSGTYPNKSLGLQKGVVEIPMGSLPDSVVGRFFAIDVSSELIDPTDSFCQHAPQPAMVPSQVLRRWFQITSLVKDPGNGSQLLQVRLKLALAYEGGPEIIDASLYAGNDDPRPVKFIIRPGAIPFDVSRAVAENDNTAVARVMLMQPNGDMRPNGDELPFARGNLIEQALGSRCWNPTGIRVRHINAWPSQAFNPTNGPDVSFLARNAGSARVGTGLLIDDAVGTVEEAQTMYRGGIGFETGVSITATTQRAISVSGDVAVPDSHLPLSGKRFHFKGLEPDQPDAGVALFLDQTGADEVRALHARKAIAWTAANGYDLMTIFYDGTNDIFRIAGAQTIALKGTATLDLGGAKIVNAAPGVLHGTSAAPANDQEGSRSVTARVNFPSPMTDDYVAIVSPTWVTAFGVTKDEAGFTVEFEKAPPAKTTDSSPNWTFDWMVRQST